MVIKKENIFLWVLVIILSILNLSLIKNDSVWCDEAFSMIQCRNDFNTMLGSVLVDSWPPFYGVTSWVIAKIFGSTVPILKIYSIIPGILSMFLGATYIKKEFKSAFIATIYILLCGMMPISIHMNVEIRGYSWSMFFVTFCAILSYKYFKYGHHWKTFGGMVIMGILAAYTHYFALVAVALIYALLFVALIIKKRSNIWICLGITVICICAYAPWLSYFLKAAKSVSKGYWIPSITLSSYLKFFEYPFTYTFDNLGGVEKSEFAFLFVALVIFLLLGVIARIHQQKIENSEKELFALACIFIFWGTITLGFIVSRVISPMFIPRYMYVAVGPLWIFIALASKSVIDDKKILLGVCSLIISVGMQGYIEQRISEYENGTELSKKIVRSQYQECIGIFSDSDYLNWTEIKYYFPECIYSESGANIEIITDQGKRQNFLFMATKDFSYYQTEFEKLGYGIEYLGDYNFDNCYYYQLYKCTK